MYTQQIFFQKFEVDTTYLIFRFNNSHNNDRSPVASRSEII